MVAVIAAAMLCRFVMVYAAYHVVFLRRSRLRRYFDVVAVARVFLYAINECLDAFRCMPYATITPLFFFTARCCHAVICKPSSLPCCFVACFCFYVCLRDDIQVPHVDIMLPDEEVLLIGELCHSREEVRTEGKSHHRHCLFFFIAHLRRLVL